MLHYAHNFGRDLQEQLDRQNYITKIPMTKLKDTNKKYSGLRGWECRYRTKGELKGGGTEKTEKRKGQKEIAVSTAPCACPSIQAPTCVLPEEASEYPQG